MRQQLPGGKFQNFNPGSATLAFMFADKSVHWVKMGPPVDKRALVKGLRRIADDLEV